ncbi:MAG: proline--tRNA ligase [Nanoarchaeota archaeon]|nr:proline--tRNA ligase [Nanoarchaeota archaeon]
MAKETNEGIKIKKEENFSEWYTQIVQKSELADYTAVSGCIAYRPDGYAIWENIQRIVDKELKQLGIKNVYFPLLIPENYLKKEAEHVKGFSPEVAWVTETGNSKLSERLAIRPTSETIMYPSYAKWIRSWRDLPMRYNQWNTVLRWEFKNPIPFIRGREFLWNEGHTVFASRKEAEKEMKDIINLWVNFSKEYMALPSLSGQKSEKEKFAGAEYSWSTEFILPNGKAVQGPDAHFDGTKFSKAFSIEFLNKDGKKQNPFQNTWAISTRQIGVMIAIHGDNNGLVIPPKIAPTQVVIIPILFDDSKLKVLKEAQSIKKKLESRGISVRLDDREEYTPGWKFNEWELKGIPLRIEIGPKDLQKKQVITVRRDNNKKEFIKSNTIEKSVVSCLEDIQDSLYKKALKQLKSKIVEVKNFKEAQLQLKNKGIIFAPWCASTECEENFKEKTGGAKSLNSPFKQPKLNHECFMCGKKAVSWFYFGKSY